MNKRDKPVFLRNKSLISFRNKYRDRIAVSPALENSFDKLALIHAELMSNDRLVRNGSEDLGWQRYEVRFNLADLITPLQAAAFSFGFDTNNETIKSKTQLAPSYIEYKMPEMKLIEFAKDIIKICEDNLDSMKIYLVTAENIAETKKKTSEFVEAVKVYKEKKEEIVKANKRIKELISQSRQVVRLELNKRMIPFDKLDSEMSYEYHDIICLLDYELPDEDEPDDLFPEDGFDYIPPDHVDPSLN